MGSKKADAARRRQRGLELLLASGALLFSTEPAWAQNANTPKPESEANEIIVRGLRPEVVSKLDRKIYTVDNNVEAAAGAATDILNKVPSVDVDTDGRISLRGDGNVTVLIDGRPSAMSSGSEALSQMLAKDIDKIEVITNPTAEFKADGSGGVINIITRKARTPGVAGSLVANAGDHGRFLLGASGSYKKGGLSLTGGVNLKQDIRQRTTNQRRKALDPLTNAFATNTQRNYEDTRRLTPSAKIAADYTFENGETLGANFSYSQRRGDRDSVQSSDVRDALGALTKSYLRRGDGKEWRLDNAEGVHYERKLFTSDDKLKFNISQSARRQRDAYNYQTAFAAPVQATAGNRVSQNVDYVKSEFSADYELPLKNGVTLKTGYSLEHDSNAYNFNGGLIDLSSGAVLLDPALSNDFRYGQTINAIYGNYESKWGDIGILAGLRIEQTDTETRLVTGGINAERDELRAYPSLHLAKDLSDADKVSFRYSRRVTRPDPQDLNPFIDRRDPRNLRSGNPNLLPKDTQSVEISYENDANAFSYHITAFYRQNRNSVTDVTLILADDVVLVSKANLRKDNAGGVEFGINGKLWPQLSYNLSGDIFYNEIDATAFGVTGNKSDVSGNAKASFDYKPNKTDTLQFSLNYTGEKLTPQGYILSVTTVNAGYRHVFSDNLSAVFTASDLFGQQRLARRFDTPALHDDFERVQNGPVVFAGLVYTFGGKAKTKEKFDFDDSGGQN